MQTRSESVAAVDYLGILPIREQTMSLETKSDERHPLPPAPFTSWLDFAVVNLPVRDLELEGLFEDDAKKFSRDDFRRAAQAELTALRKRAGEGDTFPAIYRIPPVVSGHL